MRKRYQKDSLASMKNSGEIHEQLVTYDEEGGGEMDTNGYVDGEKAHIHSHSFRKPEPIVFLFFFVYFCSLLTKYRDFQ